MTDMQHPTDGTPCSDVFKNFPGCPTCIERAHRSGSHAQCPQNCGFRRPPGYDAFENEPRYEVKVIDQDNRVIYWNFCYLLVHSSGPSSAAGRIASDARFWFDKDGSVFNFEVFATDKATGRTASCGYQREWRDLYGGYSPGAGPRIYELDYSYFDGEEGYRYFRDASNANAARSALFDMNRRLRRRIVLQVPCDPSIKTED